MKEKLKRRGSGGPAGRPTAAAPASAPTAVASQPTVATQAAPATQATVAPEAASAPPAEAPATRTRAPEGISDVKYRQIVASADEPEAAVEALNEPALLKAFVEADKTVGLQPLKVERRPQHEEAPETEDEEEGE